MVGWMHITVAVAGIFILFYFIFHHFCCHPKPPQPVAGTSSKTLFNWSDNPALITDAIENGWSQFAFTEYISSSTLRSNRFSLGSCAAGGDGAGGDVEISWEVCQESADFMQKIRLNSGLKKIAKTTASEMAAASVIKSALPLPGPTLGNSTPFPQEAYFEITVLSSYEDENSGEDENIKLIQENGLEERGLHVNVEELRGRTCAKDIVEGGNATLSVGFCRGGSIPVKFPGSYPGSVGFNSDGSISLDGIKLVSESNIERCERNDTVIGCGYNPSQKRVFFTVDSKLVYEINCMGEEFGSPLYPTIAANGDVMVLVNFGQSIFKYEPANLQRTQNPCFIGPMSSSLFGYEDSKELFSMGGIDPQWLNQSTRSGKAMTKDYDEASEADMFEIVIARNGYKKSPS